MYSLLKYLVWGFCYSTCHTVCIYLLIYFCSCCHPFCISCFFFLFHLVRFQKACIPLNCHPDFCPSSPQHQIASESFIFTPPPPHLISKTRFLFHFDRWYLPSAWTSSAGSWWRLCGTRCWKWCRWQGWRRCWDTRARWRRCTVTARCSSSCSGPSARGSGRTAASRWWTHL